MSELTYTPNKTYPLHYTWLDKETKKVQKATVNAIFTGKIFNIGGIEFGEFVHVNNQKVRLLSFDDLEAMQPQLDRVIEDDSTWEPA